MAVPASEMSMMRWADRGEHHKAADLYVVRLVAALAFVIAASSVQAASLTLGCTGTMTTTNVPKDGVAPDPERENVSDFSIVVDLDRRAVFGFWFDTPKRGLSDAVHTALPITQADPNGVYFEANRKESSIDESIHGSVDRITGAVSAMEIKLYSSGNMQTLDWDLHCKPTRPLF
jgi:hypothetical protein